MSQATKEICFPITPHLRGSCGTNDDTFMDWQTTKRVLSSHLIVQEKLDGLNIGAMAKPDGTLILIQKDRLLDASELPTLAPLVNWIESHRLEVTSVVGERFTLFGEYVANARLPAWVKIPWILFDCYDHSSGRFLSQAELRRRAAQLPLMFAPTLFEGTLSSLSAVANLIRESSFTSELMEGIYLRLEGDSFLKERYKFVRQGYIKNQC